MPLDEHSRHWVCVLCELVLEGTVAVHYNEVENVRSVSAVYLGLASKILSVELGPLAVKSDCDWQYLGRHRTLFVAGGRIHRLDMLPAFVCVNSHLKVDQILLPLLPDIVKYSWIEWDGDHWVCGRAELGSVDPVLISKLLSMVHRFSLCSDCKK